MTTHTLVLLDGTFAVCRMPPESALPDWATAGPFSSVTRTSEELSIVIPEARVPAGVLAERGWRCLRVAGTLDFGLVGVLASLLAPLAGSGIPVFVLSTFDTDYLMIGAGRLDAAVRELRAAGHRVND